jgi:hypothetical protein
LSEVFTFGIEFILNYDFINNAVASVFCATGGYRSIFKIDEEKIVEDL